MTNSYCHYESLNVTRDAPTEVIRAAYRSLSQKHHPDKNIGNQNAARIMARLNTAYSVLSDLDQRTLYDLQILGEQSAREKDEAAQQPVNDENSSVASAYASFRMTKPVRPRRPASEISDDKPESRLDILLHHIHNYAKGRDVRIAAKVLGALLVVLIPIFWLVRMENQSALLLERAAIATDTVAAPAPEQLAAPIGQIKVQAPGKASKTKTSDAGAGKTASAPGMEEVAAELSKSATAPKAPVAPSAAAKTSDYERLTAMLKSMGLGLHKLDLTSPVSNARQPPPPVTTAEAAKASPAPASAVQAAKPMTPPDTSRLREAMERPAAPDPARGDAKSLAEVSRTSAPLAASANTAGASQAPRAAIIADAHNCVTPTYPLKAYRNGESGSVLLALLLGNDGRVIESKVQKSSGSSELDRAALKALSQCKFKPTSSDSKAEPAWANLTYVWSLD